MKIHALNDWHWVGICECTLCYYTWVGVVPVRPNQSTPPDTMLECPNCHKMAGLTTDEGDHEL